MKELIKEGIEKDRHRGLINQSKLEGGIRLLLVSLDRILVSLELLLVSLDRILVNSVYLLVSLEQILVKHINEHAFFHCHLRCILNSMKSSLY
ncbi:hypothetical protein [Peribacillus frigoritolerans]|uniref:hypothetical protein n=1 Tax=Peribacillus frigoritolerans TaxID=450367 RepID=UPI0022805440|nr:hypothetical protein [Peribacillus frigoritolerans]MCY8937112.1 hypothetical protein [Peribacillus frigoritolerans]